jgi:shikimate kinase
MAVNFGMKFNQVIATGGGIVLSPKAMAGLSRNGIIVFLDCPIEILTSRIDNTRPLIKSKADLDKMYLERYDLYKKYSVIRITDVSNIEDIVEKIYEYLNN